MRRGWWGRRKRGTTRASHFRPSLLQDPTTSKDIYYSTTAATAGAAATSAAPAASCSAFSWSASTFLLLACLLPIDTEFASASLNTLVVASMYPPCPIPAISGCVRPGRTWYFRSQGSTMEGARSSGIDLRRDWQSWRTCEGLAMEGARREKTNLEEGAVDNDGSRAGDAGEDLLEDGEKIGRASCRERVS